MSAAAAPAINTNSVCGVEVLTCEKSKDRLLFLQSVARTQLAGNKTEFESPYPWDFDFCTHFPAGLHIVAVTGGKAPIVCGWALLQSDTFKFGKTLEIDGISTRKKRMGDQRIGKMLHSAMVSYGQKEGKDMIFLHAKNDDIASIYKKWGYLQIFSPKELEVLAPPSDLSSEKKEEYKGHMERMMYFPLQSDLELTSDFKQMVQKDALHMTKEGWYGGPYRKDYLSSEGGARKRTMRRRQRRRSQTRKV